VPNPPRKASTEMGMKRPKLKRPFSLENARRLQRAKTMGQKTAAAETPLTGPAGSPCATAPPKRPLVLVADDDDIVRFLARESLTAAGFDVAEAADGIEALRSLESLKPDLVVCDVLMPVLDGFAVCAAARRTPGLEQVPILMLTSLDDTESINEAYTAGATDFATKPINWALLHHRVQFLLRASATVTALKQSEERYALAAQGANDGLWDWDLKEGAMYFSPRWKSMLGYREEEIAADPEEWLRRIYPDDAARVRADLRAHWQGATAHFESEHRIIRHDGTYCWVIARGLAVRDATGEVCRMAGSQTDISMRKRAEEQLMHDAFHDALTDLPNRSLFLDRLTHCVKLAHRRPTYGFAVLFLDLDRFKAVNDSLGHLAGDRLLVEVAGRIKRSLRNGDTLARFAGDEFVVLFEDVTEVTTVTRIVERVQELLVQPLELNGQTVIPSASMGIALSAAGYERAEDILRDADTAMYRAKSSGRACYEVFDPQMHARAVTVSQRESELRAAIANREFRVFYQPITAVQDQRIVGFEALVRWQHPRLGLLAPEQFLSIACEAGLIVELGQWVLSESCAQLSRWQRQWPAIQDWFVSVNLSGQELMHPDLLGTIDRILAETGLSATCLRLELTEGSLIERTEDSLEVIRKLQERRIWLSIDDFGTGYSSFSYLCRFPFNVLKIDYSFIQNLDTDDHRFEIVKAIITMAHNLGLQVVAEGGESAEVLKRLQSLPCEYVQGYAVSRPCDAEGVTELIAAQCGDRTDPPLVEGTDHLARSSIA
jgi:diguanylate cyclase (GGDEF)-like protein/PAS domain S-box-containing protein